MCLFILNSHHQIFWRKNVCNILVKITHWKADVSHTLLIISTKRKHKVDRCISSGRRGGGVSAGGGCLPRGAGWVSARGVSTWGDVCPSACWDTHTHPWEQNDRCLWKYYLATTTLQMVKMEKFQSKHVTVQQKSKATPCLMSPRTTSDHAIFGLNKTVPHYFWFFTPMSITFHFITRRVSGHVDYICIASIPFLFVTTRKRSLGQGNIFTSVCHSVHRAVCLPCKYPTMHAPLPCMPCCYACPLPCMPHCHACPLPCMPPYHACPPATHVPSAMQAPHDMWSVSGWYTSYWNAFLLLLFFRIITARNEVGARLYFHRHLWFCPQGVVVAQHALQQGVPAPRGVCSGGVPGLGGVCSRGEGASIWTPPDDESPAAASRRNSLDNLSTYRQT